jgi:hypothetical protein
MGATGRAVSGNARAPFSPRVDIPSSRGESYLLALSVRMSVRLRVVALRRRNCQLRCWQPASCVLPSVVAATVDRAKSVRPRPCANTDCAQFIHSPSMHICSSQCKVNCYRHTYISLSVRRIRVQVHRSLL